MIIGITGKYCSGKDTAAEYLTNTSFLHISLSEIIRDELAKENKKPTREAQLKKGNELRTKHGAGILARLALQKMEQNRDYVVTSIRNITEVEVLRTRKDFILVNIDAPITARFERNKNRKREDAITTLEEFRQKEQNESANDPLHLQLDECIKNAQVTMLNDKTKEKFLKKIDQFLKDWRPIINKRPSWDEYFIELTRTIARRGTCDRGRAGAVIVKDKRILSTGYVGSPIGIKHCDEIGHQMKQLTHEDGKKSWHCTRTSHAEENAIVQAARNGVKIEGSTVYCKMTPCYTCAKMIINSGIKRVVCEKDYHASEDTKKIFEQAGVKLEIINKEMLKYAKQ